MPASSQRVAFRFLTASNPAATLQGVAGSLAAVQRYKDDLANQVTVMEALIAAGEARRLGRTTDIKVKSVNPVRGGQGELTQLQAVMAGLTDDYRTRITIAPKRGHFCTCPDWEQNGRRVGPCKHVLALGQYGLTQVTAEADRLQDGLVSILERSGG